MADFASRIKELRKGKGLSQLQMAKDIGITNDSISIWERGIRKPEYGTLDYLCRYFDVSMSYLLGETDRKDNFPENHLSDDPNDVLFDFSTEEELIAEASLRFAMLSERSKKVALTTIDSLLKNDRELEKSYPDTDFDIKVILKRN